MPQEVALYEELSVREDLLIWGRMAGLDTRTARTRSSDAVKKYGSSLFSME